MAVVRKQRGHFLEDFRPGDVYRHKGGKTIFFPFCVSVFNDDVFSLNVAEIMQSFSECLHEG